MGSVVRKFFADRGTHLAAMIAYFALLSFVPLLLLSLALLGLVHQADEGSFFVRQLEKTFPNTSLDSILRAVRAIQSNAAALGAVGAAFLLWSSLSFFSVLESAFNIVYGRPNRGWLHGKALATMMMGGSLVSLFVSLVIGSIGQEILKRYLGFAGNDTVARVIAIAVSTAGLFLFLSSAYYVLDERRPDVARGAAGRGDGGDHPRGDVPVPAGVRRHLEAQPGAADAVGPGDPARVAVRDGERDRARRRGQLVARRKGVAGRRASGVSPLVLIQRR